MRIPSLKNKVTLAEAKTLYADCFKRLQSGNVDEPLRVSSIVFSAISRPIATVTYPLDDEIGPRCDVISSTMVGLTNRASGEKSYNFELINSFERRLVYDKLTQTGYVIALEYGKAITMYKNGVFSTCPDEVDMSWLIKATDCEV